MPSESTARGSIVPSHGQGRLAPPFLPGQSGNPGGRHAGLKEVRQICRKACPEGAHALADYVRMRDEHGHHPETDGRVLAVVVQTLFTWAYGKPPDYDPREDRPAVGINLSVLSAKQKRDLLDMLRSGLLVGDEGEPQTTETIEGNSSE